MLVRQKILKCLYDLTEIAIPMKLYIVVSSLVYTYTILRSWDWTPGRVSPSQTMHGLHSDIGYMFVSRIAPWIEGGTQPMQIGKNINK